MLHEKKVHGYQVQAQVTKLLKQTNFQGKDIGALWTFIIKPPVSKRMCVPPTVPCEPD